MIICLDNQVINHFDLLYIIILTIGLLTLSIYSNNSGCVLSSFNMYLNIPTYILHKLTAIFTTKTHSCNTPTICQLVLVSLKKDQAYFISNQTVKDWMLLNLNIYLKKNSSRFVCVLKTRKGLHRCRKRFKILFTNFHVVSFVLYFIIQHITAKKNRIQPSITWFRSSDDKIC